MKRIIAGLFLFLVFASGCLGNRDLVDVAVKLKWVHQAQFAGNYVAKEKGFYEDEGLNVTLQPFSFDDPTIDAVANGEATFGITGADELVLARSKGIPIKAFALIYQINPVCAYSLKENNITKPQDFMGKTVGLEQGTNVDTLYYVMMSRLDIDRSNINEIPIGYDATELLEGKTDVSTGYIINEPQQVIEAGKEVDTILMADYGANMYADVLFATEETINNRPEEVQKFLNATVKGWQYAMENVDEAVDITILYTTDRTKNHEKYMLEKSIPLINKGDAPIGWMTKEGWENVQNILLEQNILDEKIDINGAYTLNFL